MVDVTLLLGIGIILLLGANYWVSRWPRKSEQVRVAFIPPLAEGAMPQDPTFHAQIQSVNQKISLLFSRVETLERDVSGLKGNENPPSLDWIQTVPIRKAKKKKA